MHSDPHQRFPDHLPTPYTAAEIRDACPTGRTLRYRIERAGEAPVVRVTRYLCVDAGGADQESWLESLDGRRLAEPEREHSTWLELQEHASFPAASTERGEETIDTPAGRFVCLRYTRADATGSWRFWFARELPGQPVQFEQRADGEPVFSATLLENVLGPAAAS